ncbi:AAA family ATPase [Polaribacter gangjinensis]|uniref:AAA family ATPase n=2 Tax=Polaribacter gangjinensis TaxID=574710 RepID=A0A2S7WD49_9FLAO|nr:AAA family ATPase [Polaribacter gangjinensis]
MSVNRKIKHEMDIYKNKYPILALTGPRQSGKTTFLKSYFSDYEYVNLENLDIRKFAIDDPNGFLKQYNNYVIFDEAQRVPELFSYLQTKVDEDKIMGQYILSGSQNFHLMQNITQSLAGRVALFKLLPFDVSEMQEANWLDDDFAVNLQKGFYPAIYDRVISSKVFYSNYIQTYVERDLSELINVKDLKQFRNFISLCAARVGQLLNLNSLANECGITQPTAKSWISVLESSYIVYQLQPYFSNFNKRVTKTSKLYFYDTGLLCFLLKINDAETVKLSSLKGSLFENYVINEFIKKNYHNNLLLDFWFWRDAVGHEVDLIWQNSELLNLVEIKASETIMPHMFKGLTYFEKLKPSLVKSKTIVHTGLFNQERTLGNVTSWKEILESI